MNLKPKSASGSSIGLQRAAIGLQLLLAGVLIWLLVRAVIAYLAPESVWQSPPAPEQFGERSGTQTVQAAAYTSSRLNTGFDPFHRSASQNGADDIIERGTDAPETTLNLKLFGRRAGQNGSAILQTPDKVQKAYQIGEEIMDGVTLKAVHAGYIVLSQGGRIERLTFARESEGLLGNSQAETDTSSRRTASLTINSKPSAQILNAKSLLQLVNLTPVKKNDRLQGYSLSAKSAAVDLAEAGLENGDIVSAVNNISLTSPGFNPASLQSKLSGASSITLQVTRGGRLLNVKLGS